MGQRSQTRDNLTPGENLHSRALITKLLLRSVSKRSPDCRRSQLDPLPPRFESGRSEFSHFFLKTQKPLVDDHRLASLCLRTTKN